MRPIRRARCQSPWCLIGRQVCQLIAPSNLGWDEAVAKGWTVVEAIASLLVPAAGAAAVHEVHISGIRDRM
jgi:hypothetical protein